MGVRMACSMGGITSGHCLYIMKAVRALRLVILVFCPRGLVIGPSVQGVCYLERSLGLLDATLTGW
jgi:hypothetical protein